MTLKSFKSPKLQQVAIDAMRGECFRAISAAGGNVKAAAINLGYTNHVSFYATLKALRIKLERHTTAKPAEPKGPKIGGDGQWRK